MSLTELVLILSIFIGGIFLIWIMRFSRKSHNEISKFSRNDRENLNYRFYKNDIKDIVANGSVTDVAPFLKFIFLIILILFFVYMVKN